MDVGAHCGLWSKELVRFFKRVEAFEPLPRHAECFRENVPEATLHEVALGDGDGTTGMHLVEGSSACSWLEGEGTIPVRRLDDYDLSPSFLKVDCEGYELFVLRGGEETIKRSKPVIIVEQKPGNAGKYYVGDTEAVIYLVSLGATLQDEIDGDYILSW